jgi:hypothetical protein
MHVVGCSVGCRLHNHTGKMEDDPTSTCSGTRVADRFAFAKMRPLMHGVGLFRFAAGFRLIAGSAIYIEY